MTVNQHVVREDPACVLTACTATGSPDVVEITWEALREAPVGKVWCAEGGGTMFHAWHRAKLVFRDSEHAVVLLTDYYHDDQRCENCEVLQAFCLD